MPDIPKEGDIPTGKCTSIPSSTDAIVEMLTLTYCVVFDRNATIGDAAGGFAVFSVIAFWCVPSFPILHSYATTDAPSGAGPSSGER